MGEAPKFGTSGLRGLAAELGPQVIAQYVRAFVAACPMGTGVWLGRDLRASSPRIAQDVRAAISAAGVDVTDCGAIPTPALALGAMAAGGAAIMVTGSHIPFDRNGLKFYTPEGEITKSDEAGILARLHTPFEDCAAGRVLAGPDLGAAYLARYTAGFGAQSLSGMRIGVWSQSAVGRDLVCAVLRGLGAGVVELGRSDEFVAVDTEAVGADLRAQLRDWARGAAFDAIVSTDGDGDRPLMTDGAGALLAGDILGQITARVLGARSVVTPISSNTGVEAGGFARVARVRIGSPYVIAGMQKIGGDVIGYEANGGVILGFEAAGPAGAIAPLWTRDAMLPIVAVLWAAREIGVAGVVAREPARFTAADRVRDVTAEAIGGAEEIAAALGVVVLGVDRTDGLRMRLAGGEILHLRGSGNAPELRIYAEADRAARARELVALGIGYISDKALK